MKKELKIGDRLLDPCQGKVVVMDAKAFYMIELAVESTGVIYYKNYHWVCTFKRLKKKARTIDVLAWVAIAIAAATALYFKFR